MFKDEISSMEWRHIQRFPEYEISECGDLRCGIKRLTGFIDKDGYIRYTITDDNDHKKIVLSHREVALAFIGEQPSDNHEVAHNNGSRICNHFSNLRWATRKENRDDQYVHETSLKGQRNGRAKVTVEDVKKIRKRYHDIKNRLVEGKISDLAKEFDIHHASLLRIVNGKSWSHIEMENIDG